MEVQQEEEKKEREMKEENKLSSTGKSRHWRNEKSECFGYYCFCLFLLRQNFIDQTPLSTGNTIKYKGLTFMSLNFLPVGFY